LWHSCFYDERGANQSNRTRNSKHKQTDARRCAFLPDLQSPFNTVMARNPTALRQVQTGQQANSQEQAKQASEQWPVARQLERQRGLGQMIQ